MSAKKTYTQIDEMKVLLLPDYFQPEVVASSVMHDQRYTALAENNIEMICFTPSPCRGIDEGIRIAYKKRTKETLYNGKMLVRRFSLYKEGRNPIARAFRYYIQCVKQFNRAIFVAKDYDVISVGSTPPIQGMMAGFVKFLRRRPFVYYLQDVFPDSLVGTGLAKKGGILWKIGRVIENYTYRQADKIIVISEDFKQNIMAKGVPEEKIEVVYNWVDADAVKPVAKEENPLFEEFKLDRNQFTVVYAGNLGNAQNLSILLEAADKLPAVQFVIFGSGGLENEIRTRIEQEGLANVSLLPLQPYERVSQVYSLGDVCVVSCKAGLGGSAMPSKTWSIMSCGRPVLANFDEGELKMILEKNDCGVFTHAGNVEEFTAAVAELANQRERCLRMGKNARQFILDNLTKEVGTQRYVDIIKSVVGTKKS